MRPDQSGLQEAEYTLLFSLRCPATGRADQTLDF